MYSSSATQGDIVITLVNVLVLCGSLPTCFTCRQRKVYITDIDWSLPHHSVPISFFLFFHGSCIITEKLCPHCKCFSQFQFCNNFEV